MAKQITSRPRQTGFWEGRHARKAARTVVRTGFLRPPEPRSVGSTIIGEQLIAGNYLFSGRMIEGLHVSLWDIGTRIGSVSDEIHGSAWIDDLAAIGDERARNLAQTWVYEWITRFGDGAGPGWTPEVVGRRVFHWINHGMLLLRGRDRSPDGPFFRSLGHQVLFLSKRWKSLPPGRDRMEALSALALAGLNLRDMQHFIDPAVAGLAADCDRVIDQSGGLQSRNPENLLHIFNLLTWIGQDLFDKEIPVPTEIANAIIRIAPTLRALRHADGSLARFHGGEQGIAGRLDMALMTSGVSNRPDDRNYMGYARLAGGRTSLIIDAAAPALGARSANAHASTLAFELTSGRRPLIVNCGSGARFGDEWRRACRATPSHSTLCIDRASSSHLTPAGQREDDQEFLVQVPTKVHCDLVHNEGGRQLELSHNGYQPTHGVTHARILNLSSNGRRLEGVDVLTTLDRSDEANFKKALAKSNRAGLPWNIRFHLHPDVVPELDVSGQAVWLTLQSGEVWEFRHDSTAEMQVVPSVYLENDRLKPRPTHQVVLTGVAMSYATRVTWSIAKTQQTPEGIRDVENLDLVIATE